MFALLRTLTIYQNMKTATEPNRKISKQDNWRRFLVIIDEYSYNICYMPNMGLSTI